MKEHLSQFAEIAVFILDKQMRDMNVTPADMTPAQAEELVGRITSAISSFVGRDGSRLISNKLLKDLRRTAPHYFEEKWNLS